MSVHAGTLATCHFPTVGGGLRGVRREEAGRGGKRATQYGGRGNSQKRRKERRRQNMTKKVWKEDRKECVAPQSADITVNHGDEHMNENFSKRTETKINKKGKKIVK